MPYNKTTGIITEPLNINKGGEVLVYNATSKKWVPTNPSNL